MPNKNTSYKNGKVNSTSFKLNGDWVIAEFLDNETVVLKKKDVNPFK